MDSLLIAVLALAPGIYAWWTGRGLLGRVDDPAFPELLLARAHRSGQIAVVVAVLSAFVPGTQWLWAFPLFAVALLLGGFPFRRTLYGETWGVAGYMRYTVFSFVGMAGFWLTLAFTPLLIFSIVDGWAYHAPAQTALIVGAVFALGLVVWEYAYPLLWLALHRASPLERADLQPRFDDIVQRSDLSRRPPRVFRYGAPGAYVMNALALPSVRQSRVAFGDTLLELLTPDEIAAVFAHEVSHLEHFDRRRMLRLRLVTYVLILGAAAIPALLLAGVPAYAWTVKLAWPIIVLALLALRLSNSQAHETQSDLRAGALTRDPEAMVRALTKLHHYSRMPRRWPYDFERAASHPSLAHRIQALRTRGPTVAIAPIGYLGVATVLRSTEPGAYVSLDDKRAYWFEGVPADATAESMAVLREQATSYRAVAYADLIELRVAVGRAGVRTLLARDRAGKTWSMSLHADDVAAAQQALDVLDVRLSNHVREEWTMKARVIAALLALALVSALDFSWPWIPLLVTLAKPTKASVAAMGSMAIGRVLLGALAGTLGVTALGAGWPTAWLSVAATFGIGMWACRLAWRWTRGDERPSRQPFVVATLAALAVLVIGTLGIVANGGSRSVTPLSLPADGPAPALVVLLLGAGAVLLTYRDNLRRRSGATLAIAAVLLGAFSVDGHRLLARGSDTTITWTTGKAEVAGHVAVNGSAYRLHLSPGGRRFALQSVGRQSAYVDNDDEETVRLWKFTILSTAGTRRTAQAIDLAFVDDDRVLVLRPASASDDSVEISIEHAEGGKRGPSWRRTIPAFYVPALVLDRASGTWRVTSHDIRAGMIVIATGRLGSDSVQTTRLSAGSSGSRPLHTYRDGSSLIATVHGSFGMRQVLLASLGFFPFRWEMSHVANGESRTVGMIPGMPECGGQDDALLCLARGRSAVTLWRVGAGGTAAPRSLGSLPAGLDVWDIGADGRIAATNRDGSTLAIVDAGRGRGMRIPLGGGVQPQGASRASVSYATDIAIAPGVVALLVVEDGKSEVTFYRVQ